MRLNEILFRFTPNLYIESIVSWLYIISPIERFATLFDYYSHILLYVNFDKFYRLFDFIDIESIVSSIFISTIKNIVFYWYDS